MLRKLKSLPPKSPPPASEWEAVGLIQVLLRAQTRGTAGHKTMFQKEGKKNKTSNEEELLQFLFMSQPQSPLTSPRWRREGEKRARFSSSSLACQGYCTNPIRRHQGRAWEAKSSYPKLASLPASVPLKFSSIPVDLDSDLDFHLSLVLSRNVDSQTLSSMAPSSELKRQKHTTNVQGSHSVPASGLCLLLTLFFLLFFLI